MLKKFSYLASVSILASTVLTPASHAVYEKELQEEIKKVAAKQQKQTQEGVENAENTSSRSGLSKNIGLSISAIGDWMRTPSTSNSIVQTQALSAVKDGVVGTIENKFVSNVATNLLDNKESVGSGWKMGAAIVRSAGSWWSGEEASLGSALRDFWGYDDRVKELKLYQQPDKVIPSVVCALFCEFTDPSELKVQYDHFLEKWNKSSWTTVSTDESMNNQYFLQGIIRGYVRNMTPFSGDELLTYIDEEAYNNFHDIKKITLETVVTDQKARGELTTQASKAIVTKARAEGFLDLVKAIYGTEKKNFLMAQKRQGSNTSPQPVPEIETETKKPEDNPFLNELGQSLLPAPESKVDVDVKIPDATPSVDVKELAKVQAGQDDKKPDNDMDQVD